MQVESCEISIKLGLKPLFFNARNRVAVRKADGTGEGEQFVNCA